MTESLISHWQIVTSITHLEYCSRN